MEELQYNGDKIQVSNSKFQGSKMESKEVLRNKEKGEYYISPSSEQH